MTEINVINAEAWVSVVFDGRIVAPLTTCCQASAKGCDGYIGCRKCYREINPLFGDCWNADGSDPLAEMNARMGFGGRSDGWETYRTLLQDAGATAEQAARCIERAKERIAVLKGER